MMQVKLLDERATAPTRAHDTDAGLDVYALEDVTIKTQSDAVIRTGISISIPDGWVAIVKEKSGRAVKDKLTLGACVIDSGYRGELLIHLFNNARPEIIMVDDWEEYKKLVEEPTGSENTVHIKSGEAIAIANLNLI